MRDMMELMGQVNTIANAYKRSQVLFTALDGNVFALLEQPATAELVADKTGWNPRGTAMLLDGLVALNLVTKENGAYRNGEAASACLVPGAPAWQGDILRHTQASWPAWAGSWPPWTPATGRPSAASWTSRRAARPSWPTP